MKRTCIKKKEVQNKFLQEGSSEAANEISNPDSNTSKHNYVDFHMICPISNVHYCNAIIADPMFIDVIINEKPIKMELDMGMYFAVIPENFVRLKFPNLNHKI